jgi:hypothetical protein
MGYDQDVANALDGVQPDGRTPRPWAWVRVRARKVIGDVVKKQPFVRDLGNGKVAATPSALDAVTGTAEQVAWRYVDSAGNLWDLGDFALFSIERAIEDLGPAKVAALRAKASTLRPWPTGAAGAPDFER